MAEARGAVAARAVNNAMAFIILTVWGGGGGCLLGWARKRDGLGCEGRRADPNDAKAQVLSRIRKVSDYKEYRGIR